MFKAIATVKAKLFEPSELEYRSAKASIAAQPSIQEEFINFAKQNKQEDLMYFKAIYTTTGFNLNDDVFLNKELWDARVSPVWKPVNIEHVGENIVGSIYAVQAQKLDGTPVDTTEDLPPTENYELIISGVIYKYIFPEIADDIKARSNADELYVSMETWFNDFDYALLDNANGSIKLIDRNDQTIKLDSSLRVYGGAGKYDGNRLGRALKGLTFGGVGVVRNPANPRSVSIVTASKEIEMSDELKVKLEKAEAAVLENADRLKKAEEQNAKLTSIANAITKAIVDFDLVTAGFAKTTPPEIAKIDAALDGGAQALWNAKLAFMTQTGKALASQIDEINVTNKELVATVESKTADIAARDTQLGTLTAKIAELEKVKADYDALIKAKKDAELATAKKEQDLARVNELLAIGFDTSLVESLKVSFLELEKDAYNKWLDEKKIIAAQISLRKDGGQGSPEQEGSAGEQHAKSGPRFKVSVASLIDSAVVDSDVSFSESDANTNESIGFGKLINQKAK